MVDELLKIGEWHAPWGKLIAIGWIGEQYYWFVDGSGTVSMIPAACV